MSLYNMVNGINPAAGKLLSMIGIDPKAIPRFRDVWISEDLNTITILTRTGGGNRDDYAGSNAALAESPLYLNDEDDDFDSTFAKFNYRVPEDEKTSFINDLNHPELSAENKAKIISAITKTNTEKWAETMKALGEPS